MDLSVGFVVPVPVVVDTTINSVGPRSSLLISPSTPDRKQRFPLGRIFTPLSGPGDYSSAVDWDRGLLVCPKNGFGE